MSSSYSQTGFVERLAAAALILLMALVLLGAAPARAAIVLGGGTAATGGEVKLRVSGLTDLFFGADITVRYDPAFLSFLRVDAVSFPLSATDNVGMPSPLVDVLLTVTPDTVVTGLDYFDLVFMTGGAGGATQVQLLAGGFFAFQDPIDPNDQVVEDILQNIIASVNVLPVANAVPVGNTLGLVLPGVVMVAMWRRRARRPARSAMAELPAAGRRPAPLPQAAVGCTAAPASNPPRLSFNAVSRSICPSEISCA